MANETVLDRVMGAERAKLARLETLLERVVAGFHSHDPEPGDDNLFHSYSSCSDLDPCNAYRGCTRCLLMEWEKVRDGEIEI